MPKIEMQLTEKEKLVLQFRVFEYQGQQISVSQFINSDREYSQEHCDKLFNAMLEKYSMLQECLFNILAAHGHKKVPVKNYDFYINYGELTIYA
jgi:hypothetical protein